MPQANLHKTFVIEMEYGGVMRGELYPDVAPNHVARFEKLANQGFYDGLTFHRVEPGFAIQGGDPKGDGTGRSREPNLRAEFNERHHRAGTLGMARLSEPDSANCQFYICLGPATFLDRTYTVFGQVTDGLESVAQRIRPGDQMRRVRVETR